MRLLQNKLGSDIVWTMGSFGVLAASGVVINLVIAGFRDTAALGVFNQAYAIYVVASQFAAFGLHYSVLRHTALHENDGFERERMLSNAGVFALLLGGAAALAVYSLAPVAGRLFESDAVAVTTRYVAWGLVLFPLNKVLLAYLNGLRRMKAFSVLQSARYFVLMLWVAGVAVSRLPIELVGFAYVAAELPVTVAAVGYLLSARLFAGVRFDPAWTARHLVFGGKSLLSGMFVEMNSRVDVIMIGYFLSDREVGIYSFAAMMVDGLYQLLGVIRTNFNPVLVAATRDQDLASAQQLLRNSKKYAALATGGVALVLVAAYWLLAGVLLPGKGLEEGVLPLAVLMAGLTFISPFLPFDNLLLVSGHPGLQTLQHLGIVTANTCLNWFLVPVWGIAGAALATSLSFVAGMGILFFWVRRFLRWNLYSNTVRS